jgi:hypothetical protein
MEKALA